MSNPLAGQFDSDPEKIHKDMHDTSWLAMQHSPEDSNFHAYALAHHESRSKYEEVTGKSPVIYMYKTQDPLCAHCGEMF